MNKKSDNVLGPVYKKRRTVKYVVFVGDDIIGFCDKEAEAQKCVKYFAIKNNAREVEDNVYVFVTATGVHLIRYTPVPVLDNIDKSQMP